MLKEDSSQLKNDTSGFNVLDDVIDTLRFRGSIFFHSSLAAPWGMSLSASSTPRFHVALEGSFVIGSGDQQVSADDMDIVMLSEGDQHWIADQSGRRLVASERAGEACELGLRMFQEGEITHRIMCGLVEYDDAISHPIINALPTVFHFTNIHASDSIWMTVQQIDSEILRCGHNKSIIIDRLTEILFIHMLNRYTDENQHLVGFLAALTKPHLARVLQLIHRHPEQAWTLEALGNATGMSRATLQRKFKDSLGLSPIAYLGLWRMSKAYQQIKYTNQSLDSIAEAVGFTDARTMRTAFIRRFELTPSALRKSQ
jgi:AraC-like DNA-binding protein